MKVLCFVLALTWLLTAGGAAPGLHLDVRFDTGVVFSEPSGQALELNIAQPQNAGTTPRPAILCIHGGGFRAGKRERYDELCIELAGRGYVAATVSYRLAPRFAFPAAVIDCKAAIRWLRANANRYNINSDRIGVMGESAGGHLAQFLGVTADVREFDVGCHLDQGSWVACVVSHFGPSDLSRSYGRSVDAGVVLPMFFGGRLETHFRAHIRGSPLYWVTPNAAPTLVIQGTRDDRVGYEQAVWLVDRLHAAQVEVELMTIPGAGHGFSGDDAKRVQAATFAFFDRHLK
ncbi:MAG: alpha/beta hydrolase [Opitutaceae bacterium]